MRQELLVGRNSHILCGVGKYGSLPLSSLCVVIIMSGDIEVGSNLCLGKQAGAAALFFQAALLAVAVGVYLSKASGSQSSLVIFLSLIVSGYEPFSPHQFAS